MKQIAHRVDEYHPRHTPAQGITKLLGNEPEVEAVLERMSLYSAKTLGESLCVAMLATGADLSATANRIPGRVSPLDF